MLPTPFHSNGEVNTGPFKRLVDCAVNAGCTGVVTLGVMGEAHRLSDFERSKIMEAVISAAASRLKVVVGISSQSGVDVADRAKEAARAGAAAVMASPPRMAKPNDAAVAAYYSAIAQAGTRRGTWKQGAECFYS